MEEIQLKLNNEGEGVFYLQEDGEQIGKMEVGTSGNTLTVYHTEVAEKASGKGYAKKLLQAMVDYARAHGLKVTPLCPYVHAQFKRHPDEYADVWLEHQ